MKKKPEYKWMIRVRGNEDGVPSTYYYNAAMFMLVSNPKEASRYSSETPDPKHITHACCQGGEADIISFDEAWKDYQTLIETSPQ